MDKDLINSELSLSDEFFHDAQLLFHENSIRSAESRLYYSIFHAVRALLYSRGLSSKTHKGTISLFGKEIIGTNKIDYRYAKLLAKMFSLREKADYEPIFSVDEEEVEFLISEAEMFITEIKSII